MSDAITDSNNGELPEGIKPVQVYNPFKRFVLDFNGPLKLALNREALSHEDVRVVGKLIPRKTFGENLVRTTFNPSSSGEVDDIKQVVATLINYMHYSRMPEVKPDEYQPDYIKNAKKAVQYFELAQMFAVKAFTSDKV